MSIKIKEVQFKHECSEGILVDVIYDKTSFWHYKRVYSEKCYIDKIFDDGRFIRLGSDAIRVSDGKRFYEYGQSSLSTIIAKLAVFEYEAYLRSKDSPQTFIKFGTFTKNTDEIG